MYFALTISFLPASHKDNFLWYSSLIVYNSALICQEVIVFEFHLDYFQHKAK